MSTYKREKKLRSKILDVLSSFPKDVNNFLPSQSLMFTIAYDIHLLPSQLPKLTEPEVSLNQSQTPLE